MELFVQVGEKRSRAEDESESSEPRAVLAKFLKDFAETTLSEIPEDLVQQLSALRQSVLQNENQEVKNVLTLVDAC